MDAWVHSVVGELKGGLESIYRERLQGVYLYGSHARGEADDESDVDVLVVLDHCDHYAVEVDRTSALVAANGPAVRSPGNRLPRVGGSVRGSPMARTRTPAETSGPEPPDRTDEQALAARGVACHAASPPTLGRQG